MSDDERLHEPLSRVVFTAVGLLVIGALATMGSLVRIGARIVCVTDVSGGDVSAGVLAHTLRPGVTATAGDVTYCAAPDAGQRVWYTLTALPSALLFVAIVLMLARLLRRARRDGVYTPSTVRLVHGLGSLLIVGSIACGVLQSLAQV